MHRGIVLFFSAFVYYALATFGLYVFESGVLATSIVLFGIPSYALARFSAAPTAVIVSVLTLGGGIVILLEGIAHIYGIWYTIGVDELRLFGLIPLEIIATSIIQTLFLALLYEFIFDDGEYTVSSARVRFVAFGTFFVAVIALIALHQYVLQGIFLSHSYLWILGIFVGATLATLAVERALTLRFFDRLAAFSLVASIPLFLSLFLSIANTHKVFAFSNDYLFTFTLFESMVPIEEVLLILVLPLFVATFYELYLDDGKIAVADQSQ